MDEDAESSSSVPMIIGGAAGGIAALGAAAGAAYFLTRKPAAVESMAGNFEGEVLETDEQDRELMYRVKDDEFT